MRVDIAVGHQGRAGLRHDHGPLSFRVELRTSAPGTAGTPATGARRWGAASLAGMDGGDAGANERGETTAVGERRRIGRSGPR